MKHFRGLFLALMIALLMVMPVYAATYSFGTDGGWWNIKEGDTMLNPTSWQYMNCGFNPDHVNPKVTISGKTYEVVKPYPRAAMMVSFYLPKGSSATFSGLGESTMCMVNYYAYWQVLNPPSEGMPYRVFAPIITR